ncbi:MAG: oligosaccharide flippase family protein, partial [Bacilli bacterium]|nr:oligosaccharide flippase family protein [Bacilli bacterium]
MAEEKTNNLSTTVRANVIINLLRTLTMTVISFLTFPYVTRALGDQAFGLYTWANTFVYYFLILARISVPNLAIRECAKAKNDPEKFNRLVQEFFLIQAVMTLLSFALLFLLASTVPSLQENNGLIFVLSMNFLVGVFSFEWVYIALEKHIYITVRSLLTLAFGAVLTFIFIKPLGTYVDGHGVVVNQALNEVHIYALIAISGTILTVIINLILLPKYISFKKTGPYDFKALLKPLTVLFFLSLALTLYNQTDVFVLGYLDPTKAAVGAYSVGVKGVDIIITIITSLYAVFLPRASYYYEKEDKRFFQNLVTYSLNITFFIAVPAIATMATMAGPITALFSGSEISGQYAEGASVLSALAIMMLTYSIGDNIYNEILIPSKREKHYLVTLAIGVALNVGLSLLFAFLLFPSRPAFGVALATGITDVLIL